MTGGEWPLSLSSGRHAVCCQLSHQCQLYYDSSVSHSVMSVPSTSPGSSFSVQNDLCQTWSEWELNKAEMVLRWGKQKLQTLTLDLTNQTRMKVQNLVQVMQTLRRRLSTGPRNKRWTHLETTILVGWKLAWMLSRDSTRNKIHFKHSTLGDIQPSQM